MALDEENEGSENDRRIFSNSERDSPRNLNGGEPEADAVEGTSVQRQSSGLHSASMADGGRFDSPGNGEGTAEVVSFQAHYSGPIPPPEMLAAYAQVAPDFPDRIMTLAEQAQSALIENDQVPIKAEAKAFVIATVAVVALPYAFLVLAGVFALVGQNAVAMISGAVGLLSAGPQIINSMRRGK